VNANIEQSIEHYGRQINALLEDVFPRGRQDFLSGPIWHHFGTGGKRIRPAICLITCEAFGGDIRRARHFAAAVEILHNMLLVHDDIEDEDTMRRDVPTVWVRYGVPNAVNVGDYLLARAYDLVLAGDVGPEAKLELVRAFTLTFTRTVEGQALDINSRADDHFTVDQYLRIVELKTGYYLALGMVGGAIIAGADERAVSALWELGRTMGPAFQIRDDVIDLTAGKGRGGAIGSDIREGKPSVLYAHALAAAGPQDAKRLVRIMAGPRDGTSDEDVRWAIDLYYACGAIDFARGKAEDLIAEAQAAVEGLSFADPQRMKQLVAYMAERRA